MAVSAGTRLGPYEMLGPLGAGGMGEVWKARDTRLGREVAVKLLPAEFAQDSQRRERFEREARAVAALNHPNILALYDIGSEGGMAYMVTELVPGETLRGASFPLRRALEIAAQIADGLAAAHAAGVTHRDLKPDNVMVTTDGRVKILDFGLAKMARKLAADEATAKVTEPGAVMGTVGYMSPEQVRGAEIDPRCDIFSFGVVLHEMLSGKRAFQGASAIEAMNAILNNDPPELPDTVPSALREIVSHCLEKKPEQRFQSAKDLAFALRAVGGRTVSSPDVQPVVTALPPPRRTPLWIAAALVLGVLSGGAVALRWSGAAYNRLDPIQLTPFAAEPEAEGYPSFSPDGRAVAYLRTAGSNRDLVVQSADAPEPLSLERTPGLSGQTPAWTADGTHVCYIAAGDLWCVGAAGGTPQRLMADVASAEFTRDGKSLVFLRSENGKVRLFTSSPPGAEPEMVSGVTVPDGTDSLRVSPDATKVLLHDSSNHLWLARYPRGMPERLPSSEEASIQAVSWFPDNRHVALSEITSNAIRFRLVIADTQSSARRLVVPDRGAIISLAVSPDAKRIAYSTGLPDWDIVEYSMDGKRVRAVAASPRMEVMPSWSMTGERFLYAVSGFGTPSSVWTRAADGSDARPIANIANFTDIRYSPDGRRIAYATVGVRGGRGGIETIPAAGGRAVRIVSSTVGLHLCWSPDGEWLWYSQSGQLWKVPSQGGQSVGVKDSVEDVVGCSPNGRWVAYRAHDGLHLVSPDGKQDRRLSGERVYLALRGQFGERGKVLYLFGRDSPRTIDVLDVEMGRVQRTIEFQLDSVDEIREFSVHPDGKRVLLMTGGVRYDLWMAEGFAQPARGLMSLFRHWDIPPAPAGAAQNADAPQ